MKSDCPVTELPFSYPSQPKLNETEMMVVDSEIKNLSEKAVLSPCALEPPQSVPPVVTRSKKDDARRIILNSKKLNKQIKYYPFKMDTLQTVIPGNSGLLHGIH